MRPQGWRTDPGGQACCNSSWWRSACGKTTASARRPLRVLKAVDGCRVSARAGLTLPGRALFHEIFLYNLPLLDMDPVSSRRPCRPPYRPKGERTMCRAKKALWIVAFLTAAFLPVHSRAQEGTPAVGQIAGMTAAPAVLDWRACRPPYRPKGERTMCRAKKALWIVAFLTAAFLPVHSRAQEGTPAVGQIAGMTAAPAVL